jgi:hypothetical protein
VQSRLIELSRHPPPQQEEQFLYLMTTGWKTGRRHEIEIWFVEYGDRYYVVSERREDAHWVKNILRDNRVTFRVACRTFNGTARSVGRETTLAAEISKLMDAKYGWSQGLIVELVSEGSGELQQQQK